MGNLVFSLTGPKHCGKTAAARAAAEDSGGLFIDLDVLLEEISGLTAREMFLTGKERFREAETGAVHKALELASQSAAPVFIAAGGGIIDNPGAFGLLTKSSSIIYLEVSVETAWERIKQAAEQGGGWPSFLRGPDPQTLHRKLHERRAGSYRKKALHVINAEQKTPAELSREIRALISICL
jgi:shikimate kinase/3-dehydroquinate synthase